MKTMNERISEKIKPVALGEFEAPYCIGDALGTWELKNSELLEFMEFMFIHTDGVVFDEESYRQACEDASDSECTADHIARNFEDCYGDYQIAWRKVNK